MFALVIDAWNVYSVTAVIVRAPSNGFPQLLIVTD
jgi:hypothetical protein